MPFHATFILFHPVLLYNFPDTLHAFPYYGDNHIKIVGFGCDGNNLQIPFHHTRNNLML